MIIVAIAFEGDSLGISAIERVYPEKISKLLTDRLSPGRYETDEVWYTRAFTWTTGVLRQHRPAAVLVAFSRGTQNESVLRGIMLVAARQSGSQIIPSEGVSERSLVKIHRATGTKDPEAYVRRVVRLKGKIAPELFRSAAMAVARLVEVSGERLKEEAFEFDKSTRGPKRGEVFV